MTGGFALLGGAANVNTLNANTGASRSFSVSESGSAFSANNTKTAWTQVVASTTYDACRVVVDIMTGNFSGGGFASLDVGIGGSGSEQIIAGDLLCGAVANNNYPLSIYDLPLMIPAGTRVAVRGQVANGFGTQYLRVGISLYDGAFVQSQAGIIDTMGFNSGSTAGTTVTASSSANTVGSYAQITASTANDYIGIIVAIHEGNSSDQDTLTNIAIGASGFETNILPNLYTRPADVHPPVTFPFFPIAIPAGTKISANMQSGTASVTQGVVVYGVR